MKFVICSFLFIVLIVDNKAEDSEEGEFSDLDDFAEWELGDEPPTNKAKSMHMAAINLINCMARNRFKPSIGCMRKFQKDMPEREKPENAEKFKCVFRAMDECKKKTRDGMHLKQCVDGIVKCLKDEQGTESST